MNEFGFNFNFFGCNLFFWCVFVKYGILYFWFYDDFFGFFNWIVFGVFVFCGFFNNVFI